MHYWTKEEVGWLRKYCPIHTRKELLPKFDEHFNLDITLSQLDGALTNHKIRSGRTGRFEKGNKAWNKGMKGLDLAGENGRKTQFKKGQKPLTYKPIGSERIGKDGYIQVKVSENKWKLKHRVV